MFSSNPLTQVLRSTAWPLLKYHCSPVENFSLVVSGRILLMLRCLRRAHSLDSENATLHLLIVKFVLYFKAHAEEQSSLLKEVLFNQSSAFLPSSLHVHQDDNNSNDSLISFNEQFLQKHSHSLPHFVSCEWHFWLFICQD